MSPTAALAPMRSRVSAAPMSSTGAPATTFFMATLLAATNTIVSSQFITGLNTPVAGSFTSADPGFLYFVEKSTEIIWRVDASTGVRTTFLDIPQTDFSSDGERGVLGLAFHPDYATNGRFFVYLTDPQGDIQVREYSRSENTAVANTASTLVIEIDRGNESNHNGGWIGFSPEDGYLYFATGDGGAVVAIQTTTHRTLTHCREN